VRPDLSLLSSHTPVRDKTKGEFVVYLFVVMTDGFEPPTHKFSGLLLFCFFLSDQHQTELHHHVFIN